MPPIVLSITACTTPLSPLPNDPQMANKANLLPNSFLVYQVPIKNTIYSMNRRKRGLERGYLKKNRKRFAYTWKEASFSQT